MTEGRGHSNPSPFNCMKHFLFIALRKVLRSLYWAENHGSDTMVNALTKMRDDLDRRIANLEADE